MDGKYITSGDVVGSTTPQGAYDSEVLATAIGDNYVAATTSNASSGGWGVGIWKYPSGKTFDSLQGTFTGERRRD